MRVAVPRETAPGERRVALVPETVSKLRERGFEIRVERGAGAAAGFPDDELRGGGRRARRRAVRCSRAPRASSAWPLPPLTKPRRSRPGTVLIGFLNPLTDTEGVARLRERERRRVRDGVDPADHARAADGRALVAGDRRRLQGRAARRRPRAEALPDADDGRGHDRSRPRARHRRRGRRAPGDRDRPPARRRRLRRSTCGPR